jgi:hypothetical protein
MTLRATMFGVCAVVVMAAACSKNETRKSDSAAAAPAQRVATDSGVVVTTDGFDGIHVGASVEQLSAAVGSKVPPARTPAERGCRYVVLRALPRGMRLMLVNDSVARLDVDAPGIRTAEGAQVGDAESRVVELYNGRATVMPHKYTGPTGHYVVVSPPGDSLRRIVFETDGQKVLRYRLGRRSAVDLVEGCG